MSVIKKQAAFDDLDTIDTILGLIKQLEATVLGLQQLRGYAGNGVGQEMLEGLIEEGEAKIAEVKRKLMQ
ncbi:MAG: hypothetical protein ACJ72H_09690 [Candidatus Sulfotelmatobacter sp.]